VVTGGELFRTQEQQEIYLKNGKSKTKNSMHLKRCAIDLNIFTMTEGKPILCTDGDKIKSIGDYWESLDEKNRWGGNWKWKDINHFERSVV
jgi:peptidoglycan L-alanyl-D-glutamate endopeptidase CwlK